MKLLLLLSVFLVVSALADERSEVNSEESEEEHVLTKEQMLKFNKSHKKCEYQSKVRQKYIRNSLKGLFKPEAKFKNYLFCIANETGLVNNDGKINKEALREKAKLVLKNEANVNTFLKTCNNNEEGPAAIYNLLTCYDKIIIRKNQ